MRTAALAYIAATLATGVVFIIWQYRLARNAQDLRGPLGLGPGWAIGAWFIPIANLFMPHMQLRHSVRAIGNGHVPGVVTAWTALFVSGPALMLLSGTAMDDPSPTYFGGESAARSIAESYARSDGIAGFAFVAMTAAAVAAILMVREVTKLQSAAAGPPVSTV